MSFVGYNRTLRQTRGLSSTHRPPSLRSPPSFSLDPSFRPEVGHHSILPQTGTRNLLTSRVFLELV